MNDIRFALRQFAKAPGFTLIAVLTLALGVGACTAIFTVVNSVLLRPVEFPESDRILVIRETNLPQFPQFSVSPANYRDFAAEADAFESMYAVRGSAYNLTGKGEPQRVTGQRVTGQFFDVLKTQPTLGRSFGSAEDAPGKDAVVVLSYAFWQKQFGGAPGVIGESLMLNSRPYTILGVMAYNVSQRRGEIGVRMALGATAGDVIKLILCQGFGVIAIGLGTGLVATLALAHVIQSMLYGTNPRDPLSLAVIAAVLASIALLACFIPALRATKVDPLTALRSE